jgi:hypothetical protein
LPTSATHFPVAPEVAVLANGTQATVDDWYGMLLCRPIIPSPGDLMLVYRRVEYGQLGSCLVYWHGVVGLLGGADALRALLEDIRTLCSTILRSTFVTAEATDDSLPGLLFVRIVDDPIDSQLGTESARMRERGHCLQRKHAQTSIVDPVGLIIQLARRALNERGGADDGGLGERD